MKSEYNVLSSLSSKGCNGCVFFNTCPLYKACGNDARSICEDYSPVGEGYEDEMYEYDIELMRRDFFNAWQDYVNQYEEDDQMDMYR